MRLLSAVSLVVLMGLVAFGCRKTSDDITPEGPTKPKKPKDPKPKMKVPESHRAEHVDCPKGPPKAAVETHGPKMIQLGAPCTTNADCKDDKNGRCAPDLHCSYDACYADADCGKGGVCVCSQSGKFGWSCRMGDCAVDADCGDGGYCSPSFGESCGSYGGIVGWYCHKPELAAQDDCVDDGDCKKDDKGPYGYCAWNSKSGHWKCGYSHCVG